MSAQSLSLNEISVRTQELSQAMADFVALSETSLEEMKEREQSSRDYIEQSIHAFDAQLESIASVLEDFQTIMTQAGAARWRLAAQQALQEGQEHIKHIEQATQKIQRVVIDGCERVDQVTLSAASRVADAARSLKIEDIKRLTEQSIDQLNKLSATSMKRIARTMKWFHWEKLGLALVVAIGVGIVGGLFMNDQLPWETHHKVAQERASGHILIKAWPHLTQAERIRIQQAAQS